VLAVRTTWGRWTFDKLKITAPILGPVFRKTAISRMTRTLGTLLSSGVPVLQALTIVKETAGTCGGRLVGAVHESVKTGRHGDGGRSATRRCSRRFTSAWWMWRTNRRVARHAAQDCGSV